MADEKQTAVFDSSKLSSENVERKLSLLPDNTSIAEAQVIEQHENRNGQFHRSFTPRQVHVISLGSNIGSGVFIGTGKALANGGPGNMLIAYALVCSCVWGVLQTLAEMTIAFPTPGNYIDYADRWVDPAFAFGAGFAEWLGWTAVVGAEAVFFNVLVQYWAGGNFPLAASLTIFLAATFVIFTMPNKMLACFEYATSLIKIFLFIFIIFLSLALVCGAEPKGFVHNGSYWTDLPAFNNGLAIFIGIIGGEAQNPRFSLGHATKLVPFRVNVVYMLSVMFIPLLVPSNDEHLLGGGGVAASPFVIAVNDAGIKGIPHILNAGMVCGILAISAESIYRAARVLRTMAHKQLIPERFAGVDSQGRPRWALAITCVVTLVLTYINSSGGGVTAFTWLISITSSSAFINWLIVSFTSYRFHKCLKLQNDPLLSQLYAWNSTAWPMAPVWLAAVSTMLFMCCLAAGILPLGGGPFSAYNFFQYQIGIILVVVFTIEYKLIRRTPWRNLHTAALLSGRRTLSFEQVKQLDAYHKRPKFRRLLTYVQLW